MRPIDIVDVKAGINAGRLHVAVKGKYLLLGDYQTGESIRLSDIEVKPVVHARWNKDAWNTYPNGFVCSGCSTGFLIPYPYCPNCGAKMDGEENAAD